MNKLLLVVSFSLLLIGCSPTVEPISFGNDQCHFCKMSIVDQRYGAEILTTKGKVFKYDAIECMINALCENTNNEYSYMHSIYTIDFNQPTMLVDAKAAFYLVSEALPSPMGANLTGFKADAGAKKASTQYQGEIYTWENVFLKVIGDQTCNHDL